MNKMIGNNLEQSERKQDLRKFIVKTFYGFGHDSQRLAHFLKLKIGDSKFIQEIEITLMTKSISTLTLQEKDVDIDWETEF
jgi:hypothetical protein